MNKIKFLLVISLLSCPGLIYAQHSFKQLEVGDQVPDIVLPDIINSNRTSAKISDFKGKLLILDFWSIWCGGCIKNLPELERLQGRFEDNVTILPVAFTRSPKEVLAFFQRMKKNNTAINLPSAVYPTMKNDLMTMFPCYGFPMEVWINQSGKVIAISESYYVTAENIQKALNNQQLELPLSGSYIKQVEPKIDAMALGAMDGIGFYSRIFRYSDTVKSINAYRFIKKKMQGKTVLAFYNTSIVNLFKASVYGTMINHYLDNLVSVDITDSLHYFFPANDTSFYRRLKSDAYCFELSLPEQVNYKDALALMNQELCTYFGVTSTIEKRKTTCYYLRRIPDGLTLDTKFKQPNTVYDKGTGYAKYENVAVKQLISLLTSKNLPVIVDETGYSGNIDIEIYLPKDRTIETTNTALKQSGLILEAGTKELDHLVIKKKLPL